MLIKAQCKYTENLEKNLEKGKITPYKSRECKRYKNKTQEVKA